MATHRLVVFTEAMPGRDGEFNEWYDEVHLKEVLEVDQFTAAQRFALSDTQMEGTPDAPGRYLAIYEIEAEDLKSALEKLGGAGGEMTMSDSLDQGRASAWAYSSIGERRVER